MDWGKNGETEYAVYVRVYLSKEGKWQPQNYPAHILVTPGQGGKSDLDNVLEKMQLIREKYLTNS